MVLNIDGIQKLKGHLFFNREIIGVESIKRFGDTSDAYVFHFSEIPGPNIPTSGTKEWEDAFDVYLNRYPKNGTYELFWMGLHGVTCEQLNISQIRNFGIFSSCIQKVVGFGKAYWEESKTYKS